ncbi:MAG: hypothetical protein ABIO21_11905 [Pseudomonas sp.]
MAPVITNVWDYFGKKLPNNGLLADTIIQYHLEFESLPVLLFDNGEQIGYFDRASLEGFIATMDTQLKNGPHAFQIESGGERSNIWNFFVTVGQDAEQAPRTRTFSFEPVLPVQA